MDLISTLNAISKTLEGITIQATRENMDRLLGVQQAIQNLMEEAKRNDADDGGRK